jgi:hypothetical protein
MLGLNTEWPTRIAVVVQGVAMGAVITVIIKILWF